MLDSLPSRPLTRSEVDTLSESDAIDLAFPGSPESIRVNDDGQQRVYDLLLFFGETGVVIVYDEVEESWLDIRRQTDTDEEDEAYELLYDELVEYRGYESLDPEEAIKQAVSKLYGLPDDVLEAHLAELDSLEEV